LKNIVSWLAAKLVIWHIGKVQRQTPFPWNDSRFCIFAALLRKTTSFKTFMLGGNKVFLNLERRNKKVFLKPNYIPNITLKSTRVLPKPFFHDEKKES
jgi:uncharacterized membrane protein